LPELAGRLLDLGRRLEPHQRLLEAARLERPGEGLLHDEHHAVASFPQDGTDPHAVVRGPERALGEEHDGHRTRRHGITQPLGPPADATVVLNGPTASWRGG